MRVKRQRAAPDQLLARGGHGTPKPFFKKRHKLEPTAFPWRHSATIHSTQSCFGGCTPPRARANRWMTSRYAGIMTISPSEYHPLPLTTSLLHFLLRQRAGKKATRARKPRPATLGTCLEDMPSVVKVVKGMLRCVNGTAPPPRPICCLLPIFFLHASTRSHHQCMRGRAYVSMLASGRINYNACFFLPPFYPSLPQSFRSGLWRPVTSAPPGCLTPEEPIDVSIYINFAGQEEV